MDSGELQFYDHDNNCTGRCISRNSGTSKYDIKIEHLTRPTSESDLPGCIPFVPTLSEHAYTILREIQGDSPRSSESSDHSSHQPSSTTRPVEGATIKSEPLSDSDDSGVHSNGREAVMNVVSPDGNGDAVDVPQLDGVVEGWWRQLLTLDSFVMLLADWSNVFPFNYRSNLCLATCRNVWL